MMQNADILITHAHLLSMQGEGVGYIADGAVAVRGSRIVGVGSTESILQQFTSEQQIDATGCVVLPGLINAHIDTSLALVRGVAQDIQHWLMQGILPYLLQMTPAAEVASTQLSVLQGLRTGTTTFVDNNAISPSWGDWYAEVGVRAVLAPRFDALPPDMPDMSPDALYPLDVQAGRKALTEAVDFAGHWQGAAEGRITTQLGPYAADMLPSELLREVKQVAQQTGLRVHLHVAQGTRETDQIRQRYGKRPIALLAEYGLLDEQLLAVHLTDATPDEVRQVAASGASMVLCAGMIGMIDGLVPPAQPFRQAGGAVALGSSYPNLFREMQTAALLHKIHHQDPTVMPAWDVLRMATIEGARAIGLEDQIGSIETGKQADLICVDLQTLSLAPTILEPIRNLVPNLVYSATGNEVKHVMVAGRFLLKDDQLLVADETAILAEAQRQAEQLSQRILTETEYKNLALIQAMQQQKL
ncbi:MAG: amidohydrolase family protein [Pseudomonadota bacterium]